MFTVHNQAPSIFPKTYAEKKNAFTSANGYFIISFTQARNFECLS